MAIEVETVEFINCNNKEYEICDAKAREKFDAIDNLKDMAYEEKVNYPTVTDLNNAVVNLQRNFQAGVNAIGNACTRKGSTPASSSLEDTVAAIDAIQTGGNYATLEVNEDGTYIAAEDPRGIDAYDIVVVSKDVGQPHTVVFYGPDGSIIKTEPNVPYHGSASCTMLDGTAKNGQYFIGWNPSPNNVVIDLLCYPVYGEYIIDPNEIQDSWETICADGGAHYPLGSYKVLILNNAGGDFTKYDGSTATAKATAQFHMVKVGQGEDGSTSSWIATGVLYFNSGYFGSGYTVSWSQTPNNINPPGAGWRTSDMRAFLSQAFFNSLSEEYPILRDNIKAVIKYSYDFMSDEAGCGENADMETIDKIWVPSEREWKTVIEANGQSMRFTPAHYGIDYSSVYTPTYAQASVVWARDMYSNEQTSRRKNCARKVVGSWANWGTESANRSGSVTIGFCL